MENIRDLIKYSGFLGGSGSGSGNTGNSAPAAPSDWNAAEGEPGHVLNRTHWTEIAEAVILPETAVEIDLEEGGGMLLEPVLNLEVGEEYTVTWNGVEYKTVGVDGAALGESGVILGNVELMTGEGDTGEPFVLMAVPPEMVADVEFAIMVAPLDGSTSATVSIYGKTKTVHKLDKEFLPDGMPYTEMRFGEVVPSTFVQFDDEGMALLPVAYKLAVGEKYTVGWDGYDYETECVSGAAIGEEGVFVLGNVGAVTGGTDTGEPFVCVFRSSIVDGVGAMVMALDGQTATYLSVSGLVEVAHPIDEKFLPKLKGQKSFVIDIDAEETTLTVDAAANMGIEELRNSITIIKGGVEQTCVTVTRKEEAIQGIHKVTLYFSYGRAISNDKWYGNVEVYAYLEHNRVIVSEPDSARYEMVEGYGGGYISDDDVVFACSRGSNVLGSRKSKELHLPSLQFAAPGGKFYLLSISDDGEVIIQLCKSNGDLIN